MFGLRKHAQNYPNPPSLTNIKCVFWGTPHTYKTATNEGQWRVDFQVVIAGSNGYAKDCAPPSIPKFTGPVELGGAINAPLLNGANTFIGSKINASTVGFTYEPTFCSAACLAQTSYDKKHPAADGSYDTCAFFNAYVLSKNNVVQGMYCAFYTAPWAPSYATNYGQYRGVDHYTVSQSYSYTLNGH